MRQYGIVVFGATGFSGNLLAEYLVGNYISDVEIALAGRSQERLETVRDKLARIDERAGRLPILIGDSGDLESLLKIAEQACCVATTAGPYAKYGEKLVEACARSGTHYCDLTGEITWHKTMFAKYEKYAKESGARIVHHCGFDSVPSDLGAMFAAQVYRQRFGSDVQRIEMTITMRGPAGLQGGTLDTVIDQVTNGKTYTAALKAARSQEGCPLPPGDGKTKLEWSKGVSWSPQAKCWCIPFFMASCNQPVVQASNGRLAYAQNLVYYERQTVKNLHTAVITWCCFAIFGLLVAFPPTRWLLVKYVLPPPGQGPDQETMAKCSYKVMFAASGGQHKDQAKVGVTVTAVGDPSCISTTCCLAESAMCLSKDCSKLTSSGGVMTPAYAMGDVLRGRLQRSGKFSFESVE